MHDTPGNLGMTIQAMTALLDQYRMIALLVICLTIAVTIWRGKSKDFGFWLCWSIVGLCSLTIIASELRSLFNSGELAGGKITAVPNQMLIYSDGPDFFVARRSNGGFADRSDYDWIRLVKGSNADFLHLSLVVNQNKKIIHRDTTTLGVVGEDTDPAPIRFNLAIPPNEIDMLRTRKFELELHTPSTTLPYLLDGTLKFPGQVWDPNDSEDSSSATSNRALQKSGSLLIAHAFAQSAPINVEEALKSTRTDVRSQGIQALQTQFDSHLTWMNGVLESSKSSRDLQLAIINAIRIQFRDDTTITYPSPSQFQFISPASYVRIVLDGLDTTTPLGVNSRLLLNNSRDTRVDLAFAKISKIIFSSADALHKSCLALFHLSVHYNWAFLQMDQQIKLHKAFSISTVAEIMTIIDQAQPDITLLVGDDTIQAARLDYLRGIVYGTIATSDPNLVDGEVDRQAMLQKAKQAFQAFLLKISNSQKDIYRYPSHIDVARSFIAAPSSAALQPTNFIANSERGCSDPGDAS